jgi:hypothetical protein
VLAEQPRFVVVSTRSPGFPRRETPEFAARYAAVQRFRRTDARAGLIGIEADYTVFQRRDS